MKDKQFKKAIGELIGFNSALMQVVYQTFPQLAENRMSYCYALELMLPMAKAFARAVMAQPPRGLIRTAVLEAIKKQRTQDEETGGYRLSGIPTMGGQK